MLVQTQVLLLNCKNLTFTSISQVFPMHKSTLDSTLGHKNKLGEEIYISFPLPTCHFNSMVF